MTSFIHMRGDITGALLFFTLLFLGIWQLVVSWKKLNGFSITGYPDRRKLSFAVGLALVIVACGWYFSRPGHFASPDVEGFEMLLLLAGGFLAATVIQGVLSSVAFRKAYRWYPPTLILPPEVGGDAAVNRPEGGRVEEPLENLAVPVEESLVPLLFGPPAVGVPTVAGVLLLHDYGGTKEDTNHIAAYLRARGHTTLAIDLDGHGKNPRRVSSPAMEALITEAAALLRDRTSRSEISVVGIGLGGTLAIRLAAADASVERAIALDPPTTDDGGWPTVNALRELKPVDLAAGFLRPSARYGIKGRITLLKMLLLMPPAGTAGNDVTVIGTAGTWFNSPTALRECFSERGSGKLILRPGRHATIASGETTLEAILKALG